MNSPACYAASPFIAPPATPPVMSAKVAGFARPRPAATEPAPASPPVVGFARAIAN